MKKFIFLSALIVMGVTCVGCTPTDNGTNNTPIETTLPSDTTNGNTTSPANGVTDGVTTNKNGTITNDTITNKNGTTTNGTTNGNTTTSK